MVGGQVKKCQKKVNMDTEPGELLLERKPLFIAPEWHSEQMKCFNCLKNSFVMCNKCHIVPLCLMCTSHDEFECGFLASALKTGLSKNILVKNFAMFPLFKLLLLMENPAKTEECFKILQQPLELNEYNVVEIRKDYEENIIRTLIESGFLKNLKKVENINENYLLKLCILIERNCFRALSKDDDFLQCVYTDVGEITQSCIPNAAVTIDEDFKMQIYATRKICAGDIICISYVNPLVGTHERQRLLYQTKRLYCYCLRCADPSELNTYISAIKCKICLEGYAISNFKNHEWICKACSSSISTTEVIKLCNRIQDEISEADGELNMYESLLEKYSAELHANHYILIQIKQNILLILNEIIMYNKSAENYLQRKIQLYEEILPILRILLPGISKMYAFELFEYLKAITKLAEIQFQNDYIDKEIFKQKLYKAKTLTEEVAQNLAYELPNSSADVLLKRTLKEQKIIENKIDNLNEIKVQAN